MYVYVYMCMYVCIYACMHITKPVCIYELQKDSVVCLTATADQAFSSALSAFRLPYSALSSSRLPSALSSSRLSSALSSSRLPYRLSH